ncbi:hypothetical protein Tco_1517355 [Tanacetum coccineum]
MVAVSMGEGGEGDGTAEMEPWSTVVVASVVVAWVAGALGGKNEGAEMVEMMIGVDPVDRWVAVGGWSSGVGVEARGVGDRVDRGTRNAFGLCRKTHQKSFPVDGGGAGAAVVAAGNLREKE